MCPRLAELVSTDDADELEATLGNCVMRYDRLGSSAIACGSLLEQMAQGLALFLENTNALAEWLNDAEHDIAQFDHLAVYPEELQEQSALLMVSKIYIKIERYLCFSNWQKM
jgi:hypothetical protein